LSSVATAQYAYYYDNVPGGSTCSSIPDFTAVVNIYLELWIDYGSYHNVSFDVRALQSIPGPRTPPYPPYPAIYFQTSGFAGNCSIGAHSIGNNAIGNIGQGGSVDILIIS